MDNDFSDDAELNQLLEHVLDNNVLQENAAGVARQALGQGLNSLSEPQRSLFNRVVSPQLRKRQVQLDAQRCADLLGKDCPP